MTDVARELAAALSELQVTQEELRRQNDQLVAAQFELEAERRRFAELFELAPIAYLVTDEFGAIHRANRPAQELLGAPVWRLERRPLVTFAPPHARRALRNFLGRSATGSGVHHAEFELAPRDGDDVIVRARVRSVGEGRERELRWSLEDVTAQRQTETEVRILASELEGRVAERTEEAEAERARLAAIVENVPVGLVLVSAGTLHLEAVNAAASAIFGTAVELSDREAYREDGSRYATDDWPVVRSLRTGEAVTGERAELVRPDGSRLKVELGSAPIRDPQGQIVSAISVVLDVTERERMEAAEREFVANAAHELRTPLAAIIGAIEVLQAGAKDDTDVRERFLGHIERESHRLRRLVQALLTLARTQTGTEEPKLEIVPIRALAEEMVEALEPPPRVPVEIDCPPDLAAIANPALLERVVANLVANAAQYTREGKIFVRAVPSDGIVELTVADTGPGVPEDERGRIFDRFFRGSHDQNGFGLGLAIVSQAVRAMDGTIDVDSRDGEGTVVRVRLRAATVLSS